MAGNKEETNYKPLIAIGSVVLIFIIFFAYNYSKKISGGGEGFFGLNSNNPIYPEIAQVNYNDTVLGIRKVIKGESASGMIDENKEKFIKEVFAGPRITDSENGGMDINEYLKIIAGYSGEKRIFNYQFTVKDPTTNQPVKDGTLFINGIKAGKVADGLVSGSFEWPTGIEIFNIVVRGSKFGDGFYTLNAVNTNGTLLIGDIMMKPSEAKEVILDKVQKIDFNSFSILIPENSIVNKSGEIVKSKVNIKTNYISGKDVNNGIFSVGSMDAIDSDGSIIKLISGGMAFIDIIDANGDYLKVGPGKKVTLIYNITKEDISLMAQSKPINGGKKNGYRFFDKNTQLWEKRDAKINLDENNLKWSAEVDAIY